MPLIVPSWFKGRQGKAEPAGEDVYRLTGPNLRECFIGLHRGENGLWAGFLRFTSEGPDAAVTEPRFDTQYDAWEAAFELYRQQVVV
jgi:hypothetical protein